MKILQVIPYFIPAYGYGGPVKVCFDLSKELTKRGNDVTVLTTDTLDEKNRIPHLSETIAGIKIIRFRNINNKIAKKHNAYLPIGFYSWVKNNLNKYEVVHCHDFFTYQNIIISYFCKKYNIPFIVQPHGTLSPIRRQARFKKIKSIFLNIFVNVLQNAKNIIALTTTEKKELSKIKNINPIKIEVIPNGINLKEFTNIQKINLHQKYNIPTINKIIGYIGRLQYIKGIDISLEILAKVKNKINFTYLIIGPDEGERENLQRKINNLGLQNNVIFTGILTGHNKLQTIISCDLFLFTSRNEGLPMTVLEIAALGIPQILSTNCNVPEIKKFNAGKVFHLTDKTKIINSINNLFINPAKLKLMSQNAKIMSQKKFDLQIICTKLEKIYKNI